VTNLQQAQPHEQLENVPLPAGAVEVFEWEHPDVTEDQFGRKKTANAPRNALLTAHDHLIEGYADAALAAAGLDGARATRAMQLVDQLHLATEDLAKLLDSLREVSGAE
jgi:hypothetical protein